MAEAHQSGGGERYKDAAYGACGKSNVVHEVAKESWSLSHGHV